MATKEKMWLANAAINWEDRLFRWFQTLTLDPNPMTKIRFENIVTMLPLSPSKKVQPTPKSATRGLRFAVHLFAFKPNEGRSLERQHSGHQQKSVASSVKSAERCGPV
jgi:hypothetical protein